MGISLSCTSKKDEEFDFDIEIQRTKYDYTTSKA